MSQLSRRKLITTALGATAGVSAIAVAARSARRSGLMPPEWYGIYGPGDTMTHAAQKLLTRNTMAREFSRDRISKAPFANQISPPIQEFKRLQAGGFADWRLVIGGMVARPASLSLADIRSEKGWTDSIDMAEALHPQTIIAYGMNGGELPVTFGGPLRMRVPRQLGYKSVKFINRLTVTASIKDLPPGGDYSWYAGI